MKIVTSARTCWLQAACLLVSLFSGSLEAQTFGPYTVVRTLGFPPDGIGGLAFGGGYLYSVGDYDGNIHKLDPTTGQVLGSWSVPGGTLHNGWPDDMPTGIAWEGNNLWLSTRTPDGYLRKLSLQSDGQAPVSATYTVPWWPSDVANGNGLLYMQQFSGSIQKFDPVTGTLVGSIPSPHPYIYGMTFDGQNLLMGMGLQGDDTVWVVSPQDGAILDVWHTGVDGILGMAYDPATQSLFIGRLFDITVAQIPEPGTGLLLLAGGVVLVLRRRGTKRK